MKFKKYGHNPLKNNNELPKSIRVIAGTLLMLLIAAAITVIIETMTVGLSAGIFGSAASWVTFALAVLFIIIL